MAVANQLMNPLLLQGLKCIVFDCDGVLMDSLPANIKYYGDIKKQLGLPPLTESEIHYVHSRTHKLAVEHIVPDEMLPEAWDHIQGYDSSALSSYLKRSDGIREFLWWLRDAGFKLAINTSRSDSIDFILNHLDLEGFFFPLVTSDKVVVPKPHPEGLHIVMRTLGVRPDELAYIGDTPVDERAAEAAGVRFWAYRDQTMTADVHIESFWDIKAAMQRCYKGCPCTF